MTKRIYLELCVAYSTVASIAQIARFWHEFQSRVGCLSKSLACQRKNINCRFVEEKKERNQERKIEKKKRKFRGSNCNPFEIVIWNSRKLN